MEYTNSYGEKPVVFHHAVLLAQRTSHEVAQPNLDNE